MTCSISFCPVLHSSCAIQSVLYYICHVLYQSVLYCICPVLHQSVLYYICHVLHQSVLYYICHVLHQSVLYYICPVLHQSVLYCICPVLHQSVLYCLCSVLHQSVLYCIYPVLHQSCGARRLHDSNNDTQLDGLEILKALTHMMPPGMEIMPHELQGKTPPQIEQLKKERVYQMLSGLVSK